jgi:serine/threonine protein phosphatase PrpC
VPEYRVRASAMTHRGAVRPNNEDAMVLGVFTACGVDMVNPVSWEAPLTAPVLVAVADGMGGHNGGEIASAYTVRELAAASPTDAAEIEAALLRIDGDLHELSRSAPEVAGLGTTVAGLLLGPDSGVWFNIGDSRIYRERGGYLAQLSVDDRSLRTGTTLTQCLGGHANGTPLRPRIEPLNVHKDGRWLLCSDGLSDLLDDSVIEKLLANPGEPSRTVTALWAAAMNASGRDNITIVLLEVI